MIKTVYASKKGADFLLSPNFKLYEMRCKDGSDKVLYSTELMQRLEDLRSYGSFTITINSGYRTAAYNKKIGGASKSQHIEGTAADIVVKKDGVIVDAKKVCCLAQTLGFKGIGFISSNAVHLDMRESGSYRGDERSGYGNNVTDFYGYFGLNTSQITALKAVTETNTITENNTEDEIVYKTINEVPDAYKQTIQDLIDDGDLKGNGKKVNGFPVINVTESFCKAAVVLGRRNPQYDTIEDVPASYRPSVQKLIDKKILKGEAVEEDGTIILNITEDFCKQITINDRTGLYD